MDRIDEDTMSKNKEEQWTKITAVIIIYQSYVSFDNNHRLRYQLSEVFM